MLDNRLYIKIKEFTHNATIKRGLAYTFFSFLNSGINFVLLLILAKFLLPSDYGYLNLYNTFVVLITVFITLGTDGFLSISFFQLKPDEVKQVICLILTIACSFTLCLTAINLSFPQFVSDIVGIESQFITIALFVCLCQVCTSTTLNIYRLEENVVKYGVYSVSMTITNIILTLLLVVTFKYNWVGRVYSQFIVSSIFLVIGIILLSRKGYIKIKMPDKTIFMECMIFALPTIPHSLSFWIKQGLDKYIINYYFDAYEVGIYSFALNFAAIINIVGNAFNSNNSVLISKKLSLGVSNVKDMLFRQNKIMSFAFIGFALAVIIGSYISIPLILPKYGDCIKYLLPLGLGAFFQCIYLLYVNYILYYRKTVTLMTITLSTAVLQMILSLICTKYGLVYTAYITLIISFTTAIIVRYKALALIKNMETNPDLESKYLRHE